MKGIIFKTQIDWIISYDEILNISPDHSRVISKKTIPLSKKDAQSLSFIKTLAGDEFKEVEFKIIEEHIEPDDNTYFNRGDFKKVAAIIMV